MKNSIKILSVLVFILLNVGPVYGQGASLSPYDLKESYLEKRASFERSGSKLISAENQKELDRLLKVLSDNAPNSYEYHYIKYVNSNYDGAATANLQAAFKLKPDSREIITELFGYYELTGDYQKSKEFANVVKKGFSSDQIAYYKHLMSLEKAGYLLMSGEGDAYAVLALQRLGEVSSNCKIINLDFLQNESYRKKIESELGIKSTNFIGNESNYISALLAKGKNTIAISTTVSQNYLSKIKTTSYLAGLTYHQNIGDQQAELQSFWIQSKSLLLSATLNSRADKAVYQNFLPPLLTLYKLKKGTGISDSELRKGIELLATRVNKTEQVNEIFKAYDQIE